MQLSKLALLGLVVAPFALDAQSTVYSTNFSTGALKTTAGNTVAVGLDSRLHQTNDLCIRIRQRVVCSQRVRFRHERNHLRRR